METMMTNNGEEIRRALDHVDKAATAMRESMRSAFSPAVERATSEIAKMVPRR